MQRVGVASMTVTREDSIGVSQSYSVAAAAAGAVCRGNGDDDGRWLGWSWLQQPRLATQPVAVTI